MRQYDLLIGFTITAIEQLAPALLVLALLATGWLNVRTARRFRAALIDVGVASALIMLGWLFVVTFRIPHAGPFPGAVLGTIYLVFRDAMLTDATQRRSLGKRAMRLRVVCRTTGRPPITASVLRNLVLVATAMVGINRPWGRYALNGVVIVEALVICFNPRTMRIGDYLANTRVVARERHRRPRSSETASEEGAVVTMGTRLETSRGDSGAHHRVSRRRRRRPSAGR